jgi:hypothetical protein
MSITLADIHKAADARFAPTEFDLEDGKKPVRLRHPLRLDGKVKERVNGLQAELRGEGADLVAIISELLTKVAETPSEGKRLVDALGGDAALLLQTLNLWLEGQEVGEASASQD